MQILNDVSAYATQTFDALSPIVQLGVIMAGLFAFLAISTALNRQNG